MIKDRIEEGQGETIYEIGTGGKHFTIIVLSILRTGLQLHVPFEGKKCLTKCMMKSIMYISIQKLGNILKTPIMQPSTRLQNDFDLSN